MSYNPIFDLVSGLFLIFVPLVVVGWLTLFLLLHRENPAETSHPKPGSPDDWPAWLDSINEQAQSFLEEFGRNGHKPLDTEGATEKLEALIARLRALSEERPPQAEPQNPPEEPLPVTSPEGP